MMRISRSEKLLLPAVLVFAFACSMTRGATSNVSLIWEASADPSVVGYNIYYGGQNGNYTNTTSVGNSTNAVVSGLVEGSTYYFAVTAYDAYGDESPFSNQISYIVPGILDITLGATSTNPAAIRFPVSSGQQYQLQASEDLESWTTIWQGVATSNIWLEYDDPQTGLPQRFYRVVFN